jgi:hypothetical protein
MAITDPELLSLFEDWFEELEEEVNSLVKKHGPLNAGALAEKLGLSERGATFLLSKSKRAGKDREDIGVVQVAALKYPWR